MFTLVLVPPRGEGVARVLDALTRQQTILFKDVRRHIATATFYDTLLPLLQLLNEILQKHCDAYAIRSETSHDPVTGRQRMALHRHPHLRIRRENGYVVFTTADLPSAP